MSLASVPETAEQLTFAGMPVESTAFSLKSGSNLFTDKQLNYQANYTFRVIGRCKGFQFQDGKLVSLVEVLDAEIV